VRVAFLPFNMLIHSRGIDNQHIAKGIMVTCRERVVASMVGMERLQEWV
jgi:hypothetical protein